MTCKDLWQESFTWIWLSVVAPLVSCIFVWCLGAVNEHEVLLQTQESSYRNTQNLFLEVKLYLICVSFISLKYLDGLEDLENVPKIQWLSAAHNPETVTNFTTVSRDYQITPILYLLYTVSQNSIPWPCRLFKDSQLSQWNVFHVIPVFWRMIVSSSSGSSSPRRPWGWAITTNILMFILVPSQILGKYLQL